MQGRIQNRFELRTVSMAKTDTHTSLKRPLRIEETAHGFADIATGAPIVAGDPRLEEADLILLLPARQVLRRRQTLPRAALPRLAEVLALDVAADTPFAADDVVWDYKTVPGPKRAPSFEVELAFAERSRVGEAARRVRMELGVPLAAVDARSASTNAGQGFNLLPVSERKTRLSLISAFNRRALAACAAAILIATVAATYSQALQLGQTEERIVGLRQQAGEVLDTRQAVREVRAELEQMIAAKQRWPGHFTIVDELSRILPDGTWLNEIRIDQGSVDLLGQSAAAVDLIPVLESSPIFKAPRFASPVMSDPRSAREKFSIALDLIETDR